MRRLRKMSYVGASVAALLLATSSQIWALGGVGAGGVGGGAVGGIGSASPVGGEMQFRTGNVDSRVVCARCSLAEVKSSQPDLVGLYELQHRRGQVVMQLVRSLDANDAAWWIDIAGPSNVLSVRTPDYVFAQLMAEENLNRQVSIRGLLRTNRTYDIMDVRFLDEVRPPLRTGQATTRTPGATHNFAATARTAEARVDHHEYISKSDKGS